MEEKICETCGTVLEIRHHSEYPGLEWMGLIDKITYYYCIKCEERKDKNGRIK